MNDSMHLPLKHVVFWSSAVRVCAIAAAIDRHRRFARTQAGSLMYRG